MKIKFKIDRHVLIWVAIGIATAIDGMWTTKETKDECKEEFKEYFEIPEKEEES